MNKSNYLPKKKKCDSISTLNNRFMPQKKNYYFFTTLIREGKIVFV